MTTAPALRPCPFCGGPDVRFHPRGWMRCHECLAEGPTREAGIEAQAIAAWNARPGGDEAVREALRECESVFAMLEHLPIKDPAYTSEVRALGERIGYGALMSAAQYEWRQSLHRSGGPLGSEFVSGPCYATVLSVLTQVRAVLRNHGASHD